MQKNGNKKTVIIILAAVAAVIIACVVMIGIKEGWFHIPTKASMTMDSYDTIEVSKEYETIDDEMVEESIDKILAANAKDEEVTTGTVEDGDTVTISYTGYMDGEEFDGGSAESVLLTIGSDTYIDGFEDGLIGTNIGDTVTLSLTFPANYSIASLAGQDVIFEVTVESKTESVTPELTDEWCKEYSTENYDTEISTVKEFKEYIGNKLRTELLHEQMLSVLKGKQHIETFDEKNYDKLYQDAEDILEYYASIYSSDNDTIASSMFGSTDANTYCTSYATDYLTESMLIEYLANDLGITVTDEELDDTIINYIYTNGYESTYSSADEFKKEAGDLQIQLFKDSEILEDKVLSALEDNVVYVEVEETTSETTETTDTTSTDIETNETESEKAN